MRPDSSARDSHAENAHWRLSCERASLVAMHSLKRGPHPNGKRAQQQLGEQKWPLMQQVLPIAPLELELKLKLKLGGRPKVPKSERRTESGGQTRLLLLLGARKFGQREQFSLAATLLVCAKQARECPPAKDGRFLAAFWPLFGSLSQLQTQTDRQTDRRTDRRTSESSER